jgi:hypothetical protein
MKNTTLTLAAASLLALALVPVSAQADLIAAWDFSQFTGNAAQIDPENTPATSLWANYSGLAVGTSNDPANFNTDGLTGADDYAYGTFYYGGGQYGANIDNESLNYFALNGDLTSNNSGSRNKYYSGDFNYGAKDILLVAAGQDSVNARTVRFLKAETYSIDMSGLSFVFEANTGDSGMTGSNWKLSYAALVKANTTSGSITWSWSIDGTNYTELATHTISETDMAYTADFSSVDALDGASQVFFKGTLGEIAISNGSGFLYIDNVSIRADLASSAVDPFGGGEIPGYPGYYVSDWFGAYYHEAGSNWSYQFSGLEWVYTTSADSSEIYFYTSAADIEGWAWTSAIDYPWIWSWAIDNWFHVDTWQAWGSAQ